MLPPGLRYFLAVAQTGSIREACEQLHVAQSAVSRQILKLEQRFGAQLFIRGPRGMALSSAGEILLSHAREAALQEQRVDADMASLRGLKRGHVALRTIEGFAVSSLPEVYAGFMQRYPGITMDISIAGSETILPAVRDGLCHLGIAFNQLPDPDVVVLASAPQPLQVLCGPDHPLTALPGARLSDLLNWPLALPMPGGGSRRLIDAACHAAGLTLRPSLETNSASLVGVFVATQGGVAVFSGQRASAQVRSGQLVVVPLLLPRFRQAHIALLARRGRRLPPAVESFAAALSAALVKRR